MGVVRQAIYRCSDLLTGKPCCSRSWIFIRLRCFATLDCCALNNSLIQFQLSFQPNMNQETAFSFRSLIIHPSFRSYRSTACNNSESGIQSRPMMLRVACKLWNQDFPRGLYASRASACIGWKNIGCVTHQVREVRQERSCRYKYWPDQHRFSILIL